MKGINMAKRYFHWDPVHDCVIQESDGDGNTLVTYTREPRPYGPLISEHRNGQEYVHHYDAQGSTTMLTDESGEVTDTFTYDAWGNQVARTGTTETPYRWNGRWGYQYDEPTGSYYVRARTYEPAVGRWMSVDPLFHENFYRYAENMPTLLIDPSGLWIWCRVRCPVPRPDADIVTPPASQTNCSVVASEEDCSATCCGGTVETEEIPNGYRHGPIHGLASGTRCPNLDAAIDLVNAAMNGGGQCQSWFDSRPGLPCGPYYTSVPSFSPMCWLGYPTYTVPLSDTIYVCPSACSLAPDQLASLLIHEIAHHYCPVTTGRESCAIVAQNECSGELFTPGRTRSSFPASPEPPAPPYYPPSSPGRGGPGTTRHH